YDFELRLEKALYRLFVEGCCVFRCGSSTGGATVALICS
ncbi:MAG: hypothetical protein QG574_3752, partial [Cyanobacteriota bacterium erpe_2018_sw_21hr_WHONDRS-SW48-000092_B_bin.40]|nr:hypothetical protein [Cyanobacteriota bacterium erpe_2018_sw_21hr_WHONDRS-SW48-000092_B_bin.40]